MSKATTKQPIPSHNIPKSRVFATGSNGAKEAKVRELGVSKHYDNNSDVVNALPGIGVQFSDLQESVIEFKKWRANPQSSNVDKIMYNDDTRELVIKFNGGAYYTYYDIDFAQFNSIFMGEGICRTEGESKWGSWFVGKTPSVGAAVYEILVRSGARYSRGGNLK